jgi:predicted RNA-binding Zn-ribbon protein involved in translation (DUF1610 family)
MFECPACKQPVIGRKAKWSLGVFSSTKCPSCGAELTVDKKASFYCLFSALVLALLFGILPLLLLKRGHWGTLVGWSIIIAGFAIHYKCVPLVVIKEGGQ